MGWYCLWVSFFLQVGQELAFLRESRRHWLQKTWPHLVDTISRPLCTIWKQRNPNRYLEYRIQLCWSVGTRPIGLGVSVTSTSLLQEEGTQRSFSAILESASPSTYTTKTWLSYKLAWPSNRGLYFRPAVCGVPHNPTDLRSSPSAPFSLRHDRHNDNVWILTSE